MKQIDIMAGIISSLCADTSLFGPIRTDTLPDGNGIFASLCSETKVTEFLDGKILRRNELEFYVKHSNLRINLEAISTIGKLFQNATGINGSTDSGIKDYPERVTFEGGMYVYKIRTWFEYVDGGME